MIKKTYTYEDLYGNTVTEDCYFNLTKREINRLELKVGGKLVDYVQSLVAKGDTETMYSFIEDFVVNAYGIPSEDGRKFLKNEEIRSGFMNSMVIDEVLSDFLNSSESFTDFLVGIAPAGADRNLIRKEIEKAAAMDNNTDETEAAVVD